MSVDINKIITGSINDPLSETKTTGTLPIDPNSVPEVMVISEEEFQSAEEEYYRQLMSQYNQVAYTEYLRELMVAYNNLPEEERNNISFDEWKEKQIPYQDWLYKQTAFANPTDFLKSAPDFQQAYSNSNNGKKVFRQGEASPIGSASGGYSSTPSQTPSTSLQGKRGGSNQENYIYQKLASMGYNSAAICAILSNMQHESGFNPTVYGDGGTSYGLCQWHAGRFTNLRNYCASRGLDYRTIDGQLEYLNHELQTNYKSVYNTLMNVPNTSQGAYQAAYTWTVDFEVPQDRYNQGRRRGNAASSTYWNNFGDH